MLVRVRSVAGNVVAEFDSVGGCSVHDVKTRVAGASGIPLPRQHLLCGSKRLLPWECLAEVDPQGLLELTLLVLVDPRVVTSSDDSTAKVWSVATGDCLCTLKGHVDYVFWAAFSCDGCLVVTVAGDFTARIWSASSGECLHTLAGHHSDVNSAEFSSDASLVATSSSDQTAKLWCTQTGAPLQTFRGHRRPVLAATLARDATTLLSASLDCTAKLWCVASGACVHTFMGHDGAVDRCVFTVDESRVLTACEDDGSARVWDVATGECLHNIQGDYFNTSIHFARNGALFLTHCSEKRLAKVWDPMADGDLLVSTLQCGSINAAAFSEDGLTVLIAERPGHLRIWDTASGECLRTLSEQCRRVDSLALSAGGALLSVSGGDYAEIWNCTTGERVRALRGHAEYIYSAVFSGDAL